MRYGVKGVTGVLDMAAGLIAGLGNWLLNPRQKTKIQTGCPDLKPPPGKIIITAILICFATLTSWSQSATELYNQAGQSYQSKEYRKAADDYEKLLAQGYENSEVYYNLGNCYFKLDSIAKCILSFERAMKLSPGDEDIIHNLKLARLKTVDNIKPVPQLQIVTWWNNFINFRSSGGWAMMAVALLWFALLLVAFAIFFGRRRVFSILAMLFLVFSLSSFALAATRKQQEENPSAAIVTVSSSYVKSAPDANAHDLFMIHEGSRIQLLDKVGEWNKIRLEDGKVGWMEQGKFERI